VLDHEGTDMAHTCGDECVRWHAYPAGKDAVKAVYWSTCSQIRWHVL